MYIFVILRITISDILTNWHWYLEIFMFLFFNHSSFYCSASKNSNTWFSGFGKLPRIDNDSYDQWMAAI